MVFSHGQEIYRLLKQVSNEDIRFLVKILAAAKLSRGMVYTAGNGGSAANASHLAMHLTERGVHAVCLSDNVPRFSAVANDLSYKQSFSAQIAALPLARSDVVMTLSCSGRSPNILALLRAARNATTVGLFGFGGGDAAGLCNFCISLDSQDYGAIEDCHSAIIHAVRTELMKIELTALKA